MEIVASLTEQTTAATDAILGLLALYLTFFLQRFTRRSPLRARIWQGMLGLTAAVSLTGAVAHGLVMQKATYELLWKPMLLALGLVVAAVALAAVLDLRGERTARRAMPWFAGLGVCFFGLTQLPGTTFLIFILYEVVGMVFALIAYGVLAARKKLAGASLLTTGLVLQILAAAVQASGPFEIRIIWLFDHNGIFHLIGMAATVCMVTGAARGMGPAAE